jgi:tetratricopeptide (TPR) repeat protein
MSETKVEPRADTKPQPNPPGAKPGRPNGKRKWLFRLLAMTLVPAVLLCILELGLRAGGVGHSTRFFLNGAKYDQPDKWIENSEFGRWAFPRTLAQTPHPTPLSFDTIKKPQTFRVFILGESAAQGFPEHSFNFGRILEVMLRSRYPATNFEIVNTAMTAINSHIVLPIARECADRSPDLFIVHLGNNEVVGPFGPAGVLGSPTPTRLAIQTNLGVRRTRTGQLFDSFVNRMKGEAAHSRAWGGMKMFLDNQIRFNDERLTQTYSHFRANLEDICRAGSDKGIPVIVCTIPVNLKDSAPFASLHSSTLTPEQSAAWDALYKEGARLEGEKQFDAALAQYQLAQQIDDQFAELAFRQARCLVSLGKIAAAREKFIRARDLDTLRFRSNEEINRTVREVVAERSSSGIHLADAERSFAEASPMNLPGEELFLEHVHMNFSGNYLLAQTVFQTLSPILDTRLGGKATDSVPTREQCALRLAYTDWNELKIVDRIQASMLREPPFSNQMDRDERDVRWRGKILALKKRLDKEAMQRAVGIHGDAVEAAKHDWMLRVNFGLLLTEVGDLKRAEEQYEAVLQTLRHYSTVYCRLGQLMLRTKQIDRAETYYRDALRISSENADANLGLAEVLATRGKADEGAAIYEDQLKKSETGERARILVAYGLFLHNLGRLEDAKQRLTESIQLNPEIPIAYAILGSIALRQGKKDEASGYFEAALKIQPDWQEMQNRIAELKPDAKSSKKP